MPTRPPTIIPNQCGIVRWLFQCTGRPSAQYVTCGVAMQAGKVATDAANEAYANYVSALGAGQLSPLYTFLGTTATVRDVAGNLTAANKLVSIVGSAAAANPLSANTALVVKKVTGFSARWQRGRMFWPGGMIDESQVDQAGMINAGSLSSIGTKFNALFTAMTTSTVFVQPVLLHTSSSHGATPITAFSLEPQCGTQRHRMRK